MQAKVLGIRQKPKIVCIAHCQDLLTENPQKDAKQQVKDSENALFPALDQHVYVPNDGSKLTVDVLKYAVKK